MRAALQGAGLSFEVAETPGPGAAARLAREAADAGWPCVVAVGGDGTVNEVVNGLRQARIPAVLGVVMTGRGNDACRNLGLPLVPGEAARRIAAGRTAAVDVGLVESSAGRRWFVNAAGVGFDAEVAARSRAAGGGPGTYLRQALATLRSGRPVPVSVACDGGRRWKGGAWAVVVANGPAYGGGMRIVPAADPGDGRLDVVVLGSLSRAALLAWLPTVYVGWHVRHPRVVTGRAAEVTVEAEAPLPIHADGEPAGCTPARLVVEAGALRVVR